MAAVLLLNLLLILPIPNNDRLNANPIELSPEMKQFLDENVERGLPPLQRLNSLVKAVFQNEKLKFSYVPESRTAMETFRNRSGNCLSFTLLFISMARHMDLDARFHEVEIPPLFSKKGSFIVLSQHLNSIVFIEGKTYLVDLFPEVVPFDIGGRIVPDNRGFSHFFNNIGVSELSRGDYVQADRYLKKAIETDPSAISPLINLGVARSRAGKLDEAEKYYREALKLDRKNLTVLNNLAVICELTGRTEEFHRLQKKVEEFRDKNPYYHYNLGLQAYQQDDFETALAQYEKAIKLKSEDHNFYFALARVYAKTGHMKKAMDKMQLAEKYASDPQKKFMYSQKYELLKSKRFQSADRDN